MTKEASQNWRSRSKKKWRAGLMCSVRKQRVTRRMQVLAQRNLKVPLGSCIPSAPQGRSKIRGRSEPRTRRSGLRRSGEISEVGCVARGDGQS